jgi:hypothetical protein
MAFFVSPFVPQLARRKMVKQARALALFPKNTHPRAPAALLVPGAGFSLARAKTGGEPEFAGKRREDRQ